MTEMNDKILDASRALFDENLNMAKTVAASQGSKRIVENAQLRSSEDLHKFLERYEQNQKEQAAENEKNKNWQFGRFGFQSLQLFLAAVRSSLQSLH